MKYILQRGLGKNLARRLVPWLVAILFVGTVLAVAGSTNAVEKITICHDLGEPDGPVSVTLDIPEPAVQAHLDHGDETLAC